MKLPLPWKGTTLWQKVGIVTIYAVIVLGVVDVIGLAYLKLTGHL